MGLNLNSSLLLENANEQFRIPEYKTSYPQMNNILESDLVEFNTGIAQALREVNMRLFEVEEYEKVSLNEGFIDTAKQKIIAAINSIKDIIVKVFKQILGWISDLINKIKNFFTKFRRNPKVEAIPTAVYLDYLKANAAGKTIQCADINPTAGLLGTDFPSSTVIGSELTDLVNTTVSGAIQNCWQSLDNEYHFEIMHNLDATIDNMREDLSKKIFGQYAQLADSKLNGTFVDTICTQAFGSHKVEAKEITEDLFLTAYQNIKTDKNLIDQVTKIYNETKSNCVKAINTLEGLNKRIDTLYNQTNPSGVDLNKEQNARINSIIPYMRRIVNTATEAIASQTKLVSTKVVRISQVYCIYSQIVINTCDDIVLKSLKSKIDPISTEEKKKNYIDTKEGATFSEDFERAMLLIEDAYNEECYNDALDALLEGPIQNAVNYAQNFNAQNANNSASQIVNNAQQNNQQQANNTQNNTQQQGQQQQNNNQNQQQSGNSKNAFIKWIDGIVESVRQLIDNFIKSMKEKHIKANAEWWKQNKDKMMQIDYEKVKVSGWYNYNFKTILSQSSYVKWDPNSPMLNSDKDMQNAILKQLGVNNPPQDENMKFADKIKNSMRSLGVQDNQSMEVGSTQGWNKQEAINFMDTFFSGSEGDAYKVINDDNKKLDADRQNFKNNYDNILRQLSANAQQNNNQTQSSGEPQKASAPTGGNGGQKSGGGRYWNSDTGRYENESAMLREDSLVKIFGLSSKGISWLQEAPKFDTSAVQTTLTTKGFNSATKVVDAKMKRFISFNSMAITARLTLVTEAFNQYIGLFKSI